VPVVRTHHSDRAGPEPAAAADRTHPAAPAADPAVAGRSHPAGPSQQDCPPHSVVVRTESVAVAVGPAAPSGSIPPLAARPPRRVVAPVPTVEPPGSIPARRTGCRTASRTVASHSDPGRAAPPGWIPAHRTVSAVPGAHSVGPGTVVAHRPQAGSVAAENSCGLRTPLRGPGF